MRSPWSESDEKRLPRRQFLTRTAAAAGVAAAGWIVPAYVEAAGGDWGDLTGRFVYDGKAPHRAKLIVDKDVDCFGQLDIRDESLMVGVDGGLGNVYVYVRSLSVKICPEWATAVGKRSVLDNRNGIFIPHCMKIWYDKQEFYIINSDPVAQNVAFAPLGDAPANIVIPVDGDAAYNFTRKQNTPVKIACNYHPWESAYILPREHPYVAVSAPDGTFTIPKLPVGELEFQVWHERSEYLDTPALKKGRFTVNIRPGRNLLPTIHVDPARLAIGK